MKKFFQITKGEHIGFREPLNSLFGQFYAQIDGDDANLLIYDTKAGMRIWETGPLFFDQVGEFNLRLSIDLAGKLLLVNNGYPLWNPCPKFTGDTLVMQDDGNLVFYNNGAAVWNSGTVRYADDFQIFNKFIADENLALKIYLDSAPINWRPFLPVDRRTAALIPTFYFTDTLHIPDAPAYKKGHGVIFLYEEAVVVDKKPTRSELRATDTYRNVWGSINAYASSLGYVGGFPIACTAPESAGNDPVFKIPSLENYADFPCVLLKEGYATFQDIPAGALKFEIRPGEFVNSITPEEMTRAIGKYAADNGYLGGFPTFLSEVRDGHCVHGAILIHKNAGIWMDVGVIDSSGGR